MVELINWGLFVVGLFAGSALTTMLYVIVWNQVEDLKSGKKD